VAMGDSLQPTATSMASTAEQQTMEAKILLITTSLAEREPGAPEKGDTGPR